MLADLRAVLLVIGLLLLILGAAMLAPMVADIVTGHRDWRAFAIGAGLTLFAGGALTLGAHPDPPSVPGLPATPGAPDAPGAPVTY